MTIFADASAIVAIITGEPDRSSLVEQLLGQERRLWSAMTCWESVSALRRSYKLSIDAARTEIEVIQKRFSLHVIPIDQTELTLALDAYKRYGKGSHPARLNMGDCFAYACAKANDAQLLYKGDDFALTDLA